MLLQIVELIKGDDSQGLFKGWGLIHREGYNQWEGDESMNLYFQYVCNPIGRDGRETTSSRATVSRR
jgi:hypothetical protein